jgi:hypothetical protein
MGCREHHHFAYLAQTAQYLHRERSDVQSSLHRLATRERHRDLPIARQLQIIAAVDQCLIQVKYHRFLIL